MPSRAQLELRAAAVGVTAANYVNDSALEQRVLYQEKNATNVSGTLASSTLTSDATNNADGDTITIGNQTYTYVTALGDVAATATVTSNNTNVSDGDTVTVNGTVYTFRTAISRPYDVKISTTADLSLTNLANAINGAGVYGTDYGTGTAAHPTVSSSAVASHVITLSALTAGTGGNALTLAKSATTLTVSGAAFTGGRSQVNQILIGASASVALDNTKSAINGTAGAGTTYGFGTVPNPNVTAGTKTATTLVITATQSSVNNTATTKSATHLSWTGATLAGGTPSVLSRGAASVAAESGAAAV